MAAPVYEDSGALDTGNSAADVPYPATVNSDDILLMCVCTSHSNVPPLVSGWSNITSGADTALGSELAFRIMYKRATGSESGTVAVTSSGPTYGIMHRFSGVVTSGSPMSGTNNASIGSSASNKSLTVSCSTDELKVGMFCSRSSSAMVDGSDGDFTERSNVWSAFQNDAGMLCTTSTDTSNTSCNASASPVDFMSLSVIYLKPDIISYTLVAQDSDHTHTADNIVIVPKYLTIEQEGFIWRKDDGNEASATDLAAQDVNIVKPALSQARLRYLLNMDGTLTGKTVEYQVKRKDEAVNQWRKI